MKQSNGNDAGESSIKQGDLSQQRGMPSSDGSPVSLKLERVFTRCLQRIGRPSDAVDKGLEGELERARFTRQLGKMLGFYRQFMIEDVAASDKYPAFTGTSLVFVHHQDTKFLLSVLPSLLADYPMAAFQLDLDTLIDEAASLPTYLDDLLDGIQSTTPAILVVSPVRRHDTSREDPAGVMKGIVNLASSRAIARDQLILVILVDRVDEQDPALVGSADFVLDVGRPTAEERLLYLKFLLAGPATGVNFLVVAKDMEDWTWNDVLHFSKHVILEKHAKEVPEITTRFVIDALHGRNGIDAFVPVSRLFETGGATGISQSPTAPPPSGRGVNAMIHTTSGAFDGPAGAHVSTCEPFKEQLWQAAASNEYDLVLSTLEHVEKGVISKEDTLLLAKYPFLLTETPFDAKQKLDQAKRKMEMIEKNLPTGVKK